MLELARCFRDAGEWPKGMEWFRKAAATPSSEAKREAAHALLYGRGEPTWPPGVQPTPDERREILQWLREAGDLADVEAMVRLAGYLELGWACPTGEVYRAVVKTNWSEEEWAAQRADALVWYQRAAQTGDPKGLAACGRRLAEEAERARWNKEPHRPYEVVAVDLLRRAAIAGDEQASFHLNGLLCSRPDLREPEDDVFLGESRGDSHLTTERARQFALAIDGEAAAGLDAAKVLADLTGETQRATGDAEKLAAIAVLCCLTDREREARVAARLALRTDADNETASNVMAVTFFRRALAGSRVADGARRAADSYLEPFLRKKNVVFATLLNRGVALSWLSLELDRRPEGAGMNFASAARRCFEQAGSQCPDDPRPGWNMGTLERLSNLPP